MISSSLHKGKTNEYNDAYTEKQSRIAHGQSTHANQLLDGTDFPVDNKTYKSLKSEYLWMNQKICETVSLDITPDVIRSVEDMTHIIDFTDKLILDGNEYYLVSNSVQKNPRMFKQSLKIVRWYDG